MKQRTDGTMVVSGKRKTAIAKASIKEGSGQILLNKRSYTALPFFKKLMIQEPVEITKNVLGNFNFDVTLTTRNGGQQGQIEAARLALAKALVQFTESAELKKAFLDYDRNLLIADTRRKEAYKPNDSKARSARQKSYR
jgi:small subunit ribosomal protein S9